MRVSERASSCLLTSVRGVNDVQGVDLIAGGRNKKTKRVAPKSDNPYLKLLVKVRECLQGGQSWQACLLLPNGLYGDRYIHVYLKTFCSCTDFWSAALTANSIRLC